MRIAFYSRTSLSSVGGAERWLVEVSNRLRMQGHYVKIVCLRYNPVGERVAITLENDITFSHLDCLSMLICLLETPSRRSLA